MVQFKCGVSIGTLNLNYKLFYLVTIPGMWNRLESSQSQQIPTTIVLNLLYLIGILL